MNNCLVVIRGGGDIATGIAHRLWRSGLSPVVLETDKPTVIRRTVALAEAVFSGKIKVEGMLGRLVTSPLEAKKVSADHIVPVLVDPMALALTELEPVVLVDAIMAKKNLGTFRGQAPLVIGVGPGFTAGQDVDIVVETKRGHYLGRVIFHGNALPNTGIPGIVGCYGEERVIRSPVAGIFDAIAQIGDHVEADQPVAYVANQPIRTRISGILRGILHADLEVKPGMKVGDVDPRHEYDFCFTISDKARAVGGGVLEAICHFLRYQV